MRKEGCSHILPNNTLPVSAGILLLLAVTVLSSCAGPLVQEQTVPAGTGESAAETQPEARIIQVEPPRPRIELSEALLTTILEAEFAGQRGHMDISVSNYLDLAYKTRDHKITERATRIAVFARDNEAATRAASLWIELDPRNPDPHQVLAVMALRDGNIESALEHLQSILDYTYGELDQKLLMIANLLGREANKDLIMEVMEKLMGPRQQSAEALFAFSRVAMILGRYDRALELLEQTYTLVPDDDSVVLAYVSVLQRLERPDDAIAWLEKVLKERSDNDFNLRLTYARLLTDARRYDDSIGQFELLAGQAPNNADVSFALGLLYLQSGQINEAEKQFSKLSKRGDRSNDVSYYLGRIAEDRMELQKAGIWYQGVQSGPNYFDSQVRLALILARQDRIDDARAHLNSIHARNETESVVIVQAEAEMLTEQKQYQQAMEVYDQAIGDRYNSDLLYARAMLAEKMDRLDILEADLRQIIEHEPENAQALNALGYTLADRTTRYGEAEQLIDRALELRPDDYYILDSKGWVLYRLGKLNEAINYLRKALELSPDGEIAAHLGEVLWVRGDRKEARKVWDTALKATPDNSHLQDVIQRFSP